MSESTKPPPRTFVIIDGLQDPVLARDLSARWMLAGFRNGVDIAGQSAWLERNILSKDDADDGDVEGDCNAHVEYASDDDKDNKETEDVAIGERPLNEGDVARAGAIARAFGVEIRDRAGKSFIAENELPALREQMIYEYRTRFAQSLVFGLPAIILHYIGPVLAVGGGESAGNMLYPWLIEMVLVGWAMWAGGLPILWQGVMSALHLRTTADLLTTTIVAAAFIPSLVGVVTVIFGGEPWFTSSTESSTAGPCFHAAMLAIILTLFQRWQMYKHSDRLAGRTSLMMPGFNKFCALWLIACAAVLIFKDWHNAIGFGLLFPALLSVGGINRRSPGWSMALPVIAIAPLYLPELSIHGVTIEHIRIEAAAGYQLLVVGVMVFGWSRWPRRDIQ